MIMRAYYGIALITGILIMNISGIPAIAIIHKVSAILFAALFVALFAHKEISKNKEKI